MAYVISVIVLLSTGTATPELPEGVIPDNNEMPEGRGWFPDNKQFMGIYTGCLVLTATINSLRFEHVGIITEFGAFWTFIGVLIVTIAIPCITVDHATPNWVFRKFEKDTAADSGIHNPFYVFILGLLLPAYSFTGYDGPAHMSEESTNASLAAPWGIILGVLFMIFVGWSWVLSLLFCVSNLKQVLGTDDIPSQADGDPIAQVRGPSRPPIPSPRLPTPFYSLYPSLADILERIPAAHRQRHRWHHHAHDTPGGHLLLRALHSHLRLQDSICLRP
ncbi:hypothetical protein Vretifemale_20527 [Volvox reticuliferus]|uniref:Uncharacterized protein n=1 Tax=Volvox reticuliferus TaxID=1737510 RepID=A0A8J4D5H2_9CHLO|nr:hypothetical protein Vretifemale_20527 [Volvox reticuliferus]